MRFSKAYDPFRVIGASWRALQAAPVPMIIGGILMMFFTGGGSGGGGNSIRSDGSGWGDSIGGAEAILIIGIVLALLVVMVALWFFGCLVRVGFANAVESTISTGEARLGQVFEPRGLWGRMVLTTLLQAVVMIGMMLPVLLGVLVALGVAGASDLHGLTLVVAIAAFVSYLPVILYVGLGISLMPEAVAFEGSGPTDAFKRSWDLVRGNRLQLLIYYFVTTLFALLGLLACCFGVLITGAMVQIAYYESYLRLVRSEEEQANWVQPAA